MPTKSELLEEKTVAELKDMARDKDLSGYSRMRKDELIDLIESNYTKSEIQVWPEAEEEEEEEEEAPAVEKEPEEEKVGIEKYGELVEEGKEILLLLESKFETSDISTEENGFWVEIDKDSIHDVLSFLKDREFNHLSDVTGIDYLDDEEFELIYHLWSHNLKLRGAIKVRIPREPEPSVESVTDLWTGAQIHERENHEMFGIEFTGNPNLTPLFLEGWEEIPPFRKDFDTREYVKEKYYGGKYEYGE